MPDHPLNIGDVLAFDFADDVRNPAFGIGDSCLV
jgi:hypothetical protein